MHPYHSACSRIVIYCYYARTALLAARAHKSSAPLIILSFSSDHTCAFVRWTFSTFPELPAALAVPPPARLSIRCKIARCIHITFSLFVCSGRTVTKASLKPKWKISFSPVNFASLCQNVFIHFLPPRLSSAFYCFSAEILNACFICSRAFVYFMLSLVRRLPRHFRLFWKGKKGAAEFGRRKGKRKNK